LRFFHSSPHCSRLLSTTLQARRGASQTSLFIAPSLFRENECHTLSGCVYNEIISVLRIPRNRLNSQTLKHIQTCDILRHKWIFSKKLCQERVVILKSLRSGLISSSCFSVSTRTCLTGAPCVCLRWRPDRRTRGPYKQ